MDFQIILFYNFRYVYDIQKPNTLYKSLEIICQLGIQSFLGLKIDLQEFFETYSFTFNFSHVNV